jgi:conjugal transfer pilus assembly protein TraB
MTHANASPASHQVKRQQIRNAIIIVGAILVLILVGTLCSHDEAAKKLTHTAETNFTPIVLGSNHVDDGAIWLHRAENTLNQERKETDDLKTQLDKVAVQNETHTTSEKISNDKISALEQKIQALETKISAQQLAYPGLNQSPVAGDGKPLPLLPGAHPKGPLNHSSSWTPSIKSDYLPLTPPSADSDTSAKNPKNYVPAGSFVKAMLLSGLDASAGVTSQSQPRPVMLRLLNEGTLPNHQHSHLNDCFVTGAGFGDISSERVYIRLERLSCARAHQRILDIPVYGYVSGPDGKAGVRGIAVWRENALLQRSFISGLFSGLGQGIANATTPPLQTHSTLSAHQLLQSGLTSGTSTALGKLADYNIRRAEQYQPIIEVSATPVTVVFHTGFYLDDSKTNDAASNALSSATTPSPLTPPSTEKEEDTHAPS